MTVGGRIESERKDLPAWALPTVMAVLTIALFGDALFVPGRVPCDEVSDLRSQYLNWRQFAVTEIRGGHFPLWNPYAFSGTPFFGDPQSAMLYPPNWLYLLLSPDRATSWLVAVHFFLAGYGAGLFCRAFGSSVAAAILGGILYACAGPIITNLRPGHLPLLFSAAWAPLLIQCLERALSDKVTRFRWVLGGIGVVAMLALDGYPQFAYYTAIAGGIYTLARLPGAQGRWQAVGAIAVMFAGGWAIAAVQIVASASVAGESIRAGGLSFADAATYTLAPESLLSVVIPGMFGDAVHLAYFGRWYWWEACVFVGPAGLALAVMGVRRGRYALASAAILMFVLAVGPATPLFRLLYDFLPGFSSFRATNRFALLGILMLCPLAAMGWDSLAEQISRARRVAIVFGGLAVVLALGGLWAMNSESNGPGDFTEIMKWLAATHEVMDSRPLREAAFASSASRFVAEQLAMAAGISLLTAGLLAVRDRRAGLALLALAAGQVIWFAAGQRTSSDGMTPMPETWRASVAGLPGGERALISNSLVAETGLTNGFLNVGGSNPLMLSRMARFLAAVQGLDRPDSGISGFSLNEIGVNYPIRIASGKYAMLRCGEIMPGRLGTPAVPLAGALPRLVLLDQFTRAGPGEDALGAVMSLGFDAAKSVVLESDPHPIPTPASAEGSARVVSETTDELEIEADLPASRILLITDAYSAGWRAEAMNGAVQPYYEVLPGDYCLRAVPLTAGHHHFRMVYSPGGYAIGKWISASATAIYMIAIIAGAVWKRFPPAPAVRQAHRSQAGPLNN